MRFGFWELFALVFIPLVLVLYFTPWIIAIKRKIKNQLAVFLLCFFTGWTLVGWMIALIWSVVEDPVKVRGKK